MANPEKLSSPGFARQFATVAIDVDLTAAVSSTSGGNACRFISCGVAGVLNLVLVEDPATTLPIYLAAGTQFRVQAIKLIAAGTTATGITVYW